MEKLTERDYNLLLSMLLKKKLNREDESALDLVKLKLLYKVNRLKDFYYEQR